MAAIVLLTGASGGVGQVLARELRQEGWTVALVGRNLERLRAVYGAEAPCIAADVSTPEGARAALEQCQALVGLPTALAHCAGTTLLSPLHRTPPEMYRACLSANLDSAFFTLGAFVEALRQAREPGAAVLVSSVVARIGVSNHEAIAAAKAGLEGLVRSAAATYAPSRIRINAVAPGIMDTPAVARIIGNEASRAGAAKQYPLPGIGDPADLARLMAWLLSDKAGWITGQVWAMDGGFSSVRPLVK
ncbi:MAG: SDR family oxidoreductase [Candidatus Competibacteraceae bacterium]|nr:SDR family oxidoreductase [Candidatus Competibacteraceae bacterium]